MFKKFTREESVSGQSQVKSSVQRGIKAAIIEQYPSLEDELDEILPKKTPLVIAKCQGHISLLVVNSEPLFWQERDGPFFPCLRLLHKYPDMMPHMRIDRGGIKFMLSGAQCMCPGLTSAGGKMADVEKDTPVALTCEGKNHAVAVGITKMSTEEIRSINKGVAIETLHFLGDGLWKLKSVE